jgi:hypothetical protein
MSAASPDAICCFNIAPLRRIDVRQSVAGAPVFGCRNRYRADTIDIVDFEFDPRKSESNKAKHGST